MYTDSGTTTLVNGTFVRNTAANGGALFQSGGSLNVKNSILWEDAAASAKEISERIDAIRAANVFATLVPEDTYLVASEVHDLLVKTHPADLGKIAEIKALVWEHLFIDRVLGVATSAATAG